MRIKKFNQYFENQSDVEFDYFVDFYNKQVEAQKEIVESEQDKLNELLQEKGFETTVSPAVNVSDTDFSIVTQILKSHIEILGDVRFKKFEDLSDPTFRYVIVDKGLRTKWMTNSEFYVDNRANQMDFVKKLMEYIK